MTKYANHVNLPTITISWVQLCLLDANPTPGELDNCFNALEGNFKVLGHVDRDMRNWLLVTRHIPHIGGNIKMVEEKLCSWKNKGPSISTSRRSIQTPNDPVWVNFYLCICYFIQLIEADEENIDRLVKKCNDAIRALKQDSEDDKSQHRVKEWLCNDGTGFGRLKSGQIVQGEMMQIKGSVGFSFQQEPVQSKGRKRYPYVSWKGLRISYISKKYLPHDHSFKHGEPVTFGVGFTFRGPQALLLMESASGMSNSPSKVATKSGRQQPVPATHSYSQAAHISIRKPPS